MKRILALILAFCMAFTVCATSAFAAAPSDDIIVLFTNDVHCGISDNLGYTTLATVKSLLEASGKTVVLVDCGDSVQGGTIGTLSKGEYIIDIMNQLEYDVAIPGNHEFDYGMEQFKKNVELAKFPYVSCNLVDKDGKTVFDPYIIKELNGVKVAFVGISTPKTLTTSSPTTFRDENGEPICGFCQDETGEKLFKKVQETVDAAKADGADYVVALGHLGIAQEDSPWMSTDVITHTTGIDVFLDGHSHSVIEGEKVKNAEGKSVLLSSTGTKLANIGYLVIGADGSISTSLINDGNTSSFIDDIDAEYEELVNTVVAHSDVDLAVIDPATGNRMIRQNETNLGDLCADAYRAMSGADIAFVNGGGIRADIPAGDITYGQVINVHPFGNEMCVVETSGQEILDALELSASNLPGEFGGFLHVSGLTFTIDMSVDSTVEVDENGMFKKVTGERRVKDVKVGGEPIDPEKTYTLAAHNFLLKSGGDGYCMFTDNVLLQDCVMIDNQVLINYIADILGGTVGEEYSDIYGQGRIQIING